MQTRVFRMFLIASVCSHMAAQVVPEAPHKATALQADSTVMEQIFTADQKPRLESPTSASRAKWVDVNAADESRRLQVHRLLDAGELRTGKDYWEAAFIFQHSLDPNDYLLAHTLASIAVAKGYQDGLWIMTASLDRYLQAIHQPQIYGTQSRRNKGEEPFTQEPYNRSVITDAMRKELGVPARAEQQKDLEELNKHFNH